MILLVGKPFSSPMIWDGFVSSLTAWFYTCKYRLLSLYIAQRRTWRRKTIEGKGGKQNEFS